MRVLIAAVLVTALVNSAFWLLTTDEGQQALPKRDVFAKPCHSTRFTNRYDSLFRSSVFLFWPEGQKSEWCWLKAQAIKESGLNASAVSPVGAQGVLQVMPATWSDLQRGYSTKGGPFNARANIIQGTRYMAWLYDRFANVPGTESRRELALAAYNAGLGNVRQATKLAGGQRTWRTIKNKLHLVTGERSKETLEYVEGIKKIHKKLQG